MLREAGAGTHNELSLIPSHWVSSIAQLDVMVTPEWDTHKHDLELLKGLPG